MKIPIEILNATGATEEFSVAWAEFGHVRICCYTGCQ